MPYDVHLLEDTRSLRDRCGMRHHTPRWISASAFLQPDLETRRRSVLRGEAPWLEKELERGRIGRAR
jgi:hypothetical protein